MGDIYIYLEHRLYFAKIQIARAYSEMLIIRIVTAIGKVQQAFGSTVGYS
jgi:hypothetical protein